MKKFVRNNFFMISFAFVFVAVLYGAFIIKKSSDTTNVVVDKSDEQDLSKLMETNLTPKIVKCNFTGTYKVEQDIAFSRNGAKCNDFESRTLTYNNVIASCSGYLDPHQELFLNCISTDNPVLKCDGVIYVNVDGTAACEYWIHVKKID